MTAATNTIVPLTRQQLFDQMVRGLEGQGWRRSSSSLSETATCFYRGADGLRCAVGHILPDEQFHPDDNASPLTGLLAGRPGLATLFGVVYDSRVGEVDEDTEDGNLPFLLAAQRCHDNEPVPSSMRGAFIKLGEEYDLTWPQDVPQKGHC